MIQNKKFELWNGTKFGLILFLSSILLGILSEIFKKINLWTDPLYNYRKMRTAGENEEKTNITTTNKVWFEGCNTNEEIKERYKKLSKVLHPDNGGNDNAYAAMCNEYKYLIRKEN